MARWTDLATWRGPTPNEGGRMAEHRGVVVHIAEGSYEGTIAWQRNPAAEVSSHFVVSKGGAVAQVVDTDTVAWTQADGNGRWLSVENEGFGGQKLTPAQVEANAQLLARAHKAYGVPLQLATSPSGKGLGHHAMGGAAWGGHLQCPGAPIIAQKAAIVARAKEITEGDDMPLTDADVAKIWNSDRIPAPKAPYADKDLPTNPTWQPDNTLAEIVRQGRENEAAIAGLKAAIAELAQAVAALGAPTVSYTASGDVTLTPKV